MFNLAFFKYFSNIGLLNSASSKYLQNSSYIDSTSLIKCSFPSECNLSWSFSWISFLIACFLYSTLLLERIDINLGPIVVTLLLLLKEAFIVSLPSPVLKFSSYTKVVGSKSFFINKSTVFLSKIKLAIASALLDIPLCIIVIALFCISSEVCGLVCSLVLLSSTGELVTILYLTFGLEEVLVKLLPLSLGFVLTLTKSLFIIKSL